MAYNEIEQRGTSDFPFAFFRKSTLQILGDDMPSVSDDVIDNQIENVGDAVKNPKREQGHRIENQIKQHSHSHCSQGFCVFKDGVDNVVAVLPDVGAVGVRDFPDENRFHAASSPENHVGSAVANHHGVGEINVGKVVFSLQCHADFGFAAVAPAAGKVRTYVNPVDVHPQFL